MRFAKHRGGKNQNQPKVVASRDSSLPLALWAESYDRGEQAPRIANASKWGAGLCVARVKAVLLRA